MAEKFEINLLEESEIEFGLTIEGSNSDIGSTKPKIRFIITEEKSGKGWIFLAEKRNGNFVATIPSLKGQVSESGKYNGKLEVIFGNKYFTPTEMDIQFVEPLKIESVVINNNPKSDDLLIESVIIQKKIEYKDLTELNKIEVNKQFLINCKNKGINNPLKTLKEGTKQEKIILKSLLDNAIKDFIKK